MNYSSNVSRQQVKTLHYNVDADELEKQVKILSEWKRQATVQLEYFRIACSLYNFCDVSPLNKLLD